MTGAKESSQTRLLRSLKLYNALEIDLWEEGLSTPLPVEKDSEPISEPFQVSPKLFEAAKKLEEHETELRIANLTASCLTMLEMLGRRAP